jgi:hypothetical protein
MGKENERYGVHPRPEKLNEPVLRGKVGGPTENVGSDLWAEGEATLEELLLQFVDPYQCKNVSRKIAFGCPARQGGEEKGLLPEAAPIL